MKSPILFCLSIFLSFYHLNAQDTISLSDYSFEVTALTDEKFISFNQKQLDNSQFIMIGEQHGIKEVGELTNAIYDISQPFGYKTLCIETDAIAAEKIEKMAASGNPIEQAKSIHKDFPFSIPFYNNEDDYTLFTNVTSKKGAIWGIDQTFMVQFRLNFDYIINTTSNTLLKNKLIVLKQEADLSYTQAIEKKDFTAPYIFKYNESLHRELLTLTTDPKELEILNQLWKTKEIYTYNHTKEYYKNNNTRGQLMKRNFMRYYNEANKAEAIPKVIFKLGANHAAKGLTRTNIYDISNMVSEIAATNNKNSVHYLVMGITGKAATGNPFIPHPVIPFDNTKKFPDEIKEVLPTITQKYYVLDLVSLRKHGYGKKFSQDFKNVIFGYDVLVLVSNCEPFKGF
ncbi:hypothetical protein [Aquimarina sp. 2201CG5-10]|uniref:hypothetical protein n=1 Tax=Aquimarina callyspongiae TaxID=3098150 RepID=UPI002AB45886|nr:hypothetical protein [Aquimarina sp. 2201CG5-10]MDY8136165.1 hypothetical protein [Aquimarina sp. 2201CG5-10]